MLKMNPAKNLYKQYPHRPKGKQLSFSPMRTGYLVTSPSLQLLGLIQRHAPTRVSRSADRRVDEMMQTVGLSVTRISGMGRGGPAESTSRRWDPHAETHPEIR